MNLDDPSMIDSSSLTLPGDPALAQESQKILSQRCASCHGSVGQGGLNQITDLSTLVRDGWIRPQDPNGSALMSEITTGSMPPSGPFVSIEANNGKPHESSPYAPYPALA